MSNKSLLMFVAVIGLLLYNFIPKFIYSAANTHKNIETNISQTIEKANDTLTHLVVDYSRPIKDGIKAGKYDYINENITEKHFPVSKDEHGRKEQTFTLYHFGNGVESDYAIAQMEKDGKRPATLRELLAFGEANPELQRQFSIIALGSVWVGRSGDNYFAYLGSGSDGRGLGLSWYSSGWGDRCRFLAVGKLS